MGNFLKGLLGLGILIGFAFAAGVRVHPEILSAPKSNTAGWVSPKAVELTLKNGEKITGKIVKKTPDGIVFSFEGAEVNFSNSEIASESEADARVSKQVAEAGAQLSSLVTYEPDQNLFNRFFPSPKPQRKTGGAGASALWAVKAKPAMPAASNPASGAAKADPHSLMGIYQKSMSKESLENWKNDSIAQLNATRNPFVQARNAVADAEKAKNAQIAKMKEIEEKMAKLDS